MGILYSGCDPLRQRKIPTKKVLPIVRNQQEKTEDKISGLSATSASERKLRTLATAGFAAGSAQDSCDVDVDGAEELMPVALRDTLRGDIIAQVAGAQPVAEEPEGEEDEDDEAPVRPSASAVMEALNVARLFFSFEEGEEDSLRRVRALEQRAAAVAFREKKQMVITDFFGQ
ncbi:hypothetical protein HPB52_005918 [Rhipicephalus sanguineus]|uniref:Uncharacterized protein n=1 Tax=Rhipicephalus sanguineus TaxID=34632 RepID=A0A9D4PM80_RHISA|nr:hypothetical protein HPB52_005918 [Rhipicephalus sanguineus]